MLNSTSIFDRPGIEQLCRRHRLEPQVMRKLRNDLFKRFHTDEVALAGFSAAAELRLHSLEVYRQCDSTVDGATKLLFRTASGMLLESVILRIATGRTTLCLSSQIGCAAACDFCATAKMGIAQNLSTDEILDQVLQAGQRLAAEGRTIRNLVFMGMGEPFHNEENLYAALDTLTAPDMFHHSPAKILVSTVGIADAMIRCAERFPKVNQAISLHSVRQKVRERLIPIARKYPLDQIREALVELNNLQRTPVMIEYLMLAGVNDTINDADALVAWLEGLKVHVNLIPYNPIDESPHLVASDRLSRKAFADRLKQTGLKCTIRYSLGADIAAACGQLVRQENRKIGQAGRVRRSVDENLPNGEKTHLKK